MSLCSAFHIDWICIKKPPVLWDHLFALANIDTTLNGSNFIVSYSRFKNQCLLRDSKAKQWYRPKMTKRIPYHRQWIKITREIQFLILIWSRPKPNVYKKNWYYRNRQLHLDRWFSCFYIVLQLESVLYKIAKINFIYII